MSALQKLKAYFGMMPADELEEYEEDRYGGYGSAYQSDADDYDSYPSRRPLRSPRPVTRLEPTDDYPGYEDGRNRRPWTPDSTARPVPATRGALAEQPQAEPLSRPRPAPEPAAHPLSKITTLHPRSYLEARTIGERYREGIPVIINLTDLDDADAKRLVDFAAGLAFGLRGSMDKVTNKVFLISPPDVDVTAEDRRRIAEGGFFG
jgi:cell division inhibitor SepF